MTPFGEPKSQFAACHLALFLIHVGGYDGMEQLEALEGCATVGVVPHQLREVCGGALACAVGALVMRTHLCSPLLPQPFH